MRIWHDVKVWCNHVSACPKCEATPPRGAGMLLVAGPESGPGDSRAPAPRHPGHIYTVPTVYLHYRVLLSITEYAYKSMPVKSSPAIEIVLAKYFV